MKLHPLCSMFPPMIQDDLNRLVLDIKENGLQEPIVIYDGMVLDGQNRMKACEFTGVQPRFVEYTGNNPLGFVVSKNMSRRHLNESQRAMLGSRIAQIRQGDRSKNPGIRQSDAAEIFNVSEVSIRRAKVVLNSGDKDLVNRVESGNLPVTVAAKIARLDEGARKAVLADDRPEHAIKKHMRAEKEKELADNVRDLPNQAFGVIYADPPWRYVTISENGMDRSAENHYPTLDTDTICLLDVPSISAPDCILFLWATAPMLQDALRVMADWEFDYKTQFIWVKDRLGMGYWNRSRHEILLVGTKGNVPAPAMGTQWPSVIDAPLGAHSEKPELFLEMIEEYFPTVPKIELNRRGLPRSGWSAWGLEVEDEEIDAQYA
mgnify:CR=1 FL=1